MQKPGALANDQFNQIPTAGWRGAGKAGCASSLYCRELNLTERLCPIPATVDRLIKLINKLQCAQEEEKRRAHVAAKAACARSLSQGGVQRRSRILASRWRLCRLEHKTDRSEEALSKNHICGRTGLGLPSPVKMSSTSRPGFGLLLRDKKHTEHTQYNVPTIVLLSARV